MIEIILKDGKKHFRPFEVIEGKIKYNLAKPAPKIEVDLIWTTMGKGTTDNFKADSASISTLGSISGDGHFRLIAPSGPYSFSGKLVSVIWMISCGTEDNQDFVEKEIVISPTRREVVV